MALSHFCNGPNGQHQTFDALGVFQKVSEGLPKGFQGLWGGGGGWGLEYEPGPPWEHPPCLETNKKLPDADQARVGQHTPMFTRGMPWMAYAASTTWLEMSRIARLKEFTNGVVVGMSAKRANAYFPLVRVLSSLSGIPCLTSVVRGK